MTDQSRSSACAVLREALPIGAFFLAEILVGIIDLAVVGTLGTQPLAAVGLGRTILFALLTVGIAVLSAGTVLMSEAPTARRCGQTVVNSLVVALFFQAAAVEIGSHSAVLLTRTGYDLHLAVLFRDYARILAWAIGPAMLFATLKNVLIAAGRTGIIAGVSVGIVLANLAGCLLLVRGAGQWAGLGVAGAAWATFGVNTAAAMILLAFVLHNSLIEFTGSNLRDVWVTTRRIAALGWAMGAQQFLESMLFVVVLYLLGLHSAAWLAAGTVVFAVMEVNYAMSSALGEVLASRIASLRARREAAELTRMLRLGGGMSALAAGALALAVGLFPQCAVSVFSGSGVTEATRSLMGELLRWTAPLFLFDAWQIVCVHSLRGLRRVVVPMMLSAGCYWLIGIGSGLFLAERAGFGASGVWIGFCAGLCAAALLLVVLVSKTATRIQSPAM